MKNAGKMDQGNVPVTCNPLRKYLKDPVHLRVLCRRCQPTLFALKIKKKEREMNLHTEMIDDKARHPAKLLDRGRVFRCSFTIKNRLMIGW